MIRKLYLSNFKCFRELALPLAPLTVLSGFNASGKSTAVQGLLLIAQALRSDATSNQIPLNGSCIELGTPGDVIRDGGRDGRELKIGFETDGVAFDWTLLADDRTTGLALKSKSISVTTGDGTGISFDSLSRILEPSADVPTVVKDSIENLKRLVVLSVIRPATNDVFPSPQEGLPVHGNVGANGQYAPWWFNKLSDEDVDADRCHESDSARPLRRQLSAWAGTLFPGAQANAPHLPGTNLYRLELRIGDAEDWRRPVNIGYGLSYAFPILVAGLVAKKGQVLYIDSPEAHLHPAAQSAMGQFLARIAHAGVQLLVETHSDHVMNGMRLAVRRSLISERDILFHFFSKALETPTHTTVEAITVDRSGRMSAWPPGFFDQIERDLALL